MKNKYVLCCMMLGISFILNGCNKSEIPEEDFTFNQNLSDDNMVDKASDNDATEASSEMNIESRTEASSEINSENKIEISSEIDSENKIEISSEINSESKIEESNEINDEISENAYFLSVNGDFSKKVANNPIDQKYIVNADAPAMEIWQSSLEKCEVWNQQIDFTASELGKLLDESSYEQLQNAVSLWHEYYQEELSQSRELYGNGGMILGSMYTAISADMLTEKCRLTSITLLSQEYELSGNTSYVENTTITNNDGEYSVLPQNFCIEYTSDFEEELMSYAINEKSSDELEVLIQETSNKIEEKFGHDYTEHANKYVSFIQTLHTVESNISADDNLCLALKENRLKLYATELLNILYMLDEQ